MEVFLEVSSFLESTCLKYRNLSESSQNVENSRIELVLSLGWLLSLSQ
jgi:hypothetical protein